MAVVNNAALNLGISSCLGLLMLLGIPKELQANVEMLYLTFYEAPVSSPQYFK